jgi:hypothetical protein
MHERTGAMSRTAVLIAEAKRASARSYMVRSKAMSIAGWALLLRRDAARLRQAPAAEGKSQEEG